MIWQIQQPQPWVTLLAWSVWMIHFVDLGHRNSWLRHLDAKRSVKVPDPISSSLSGLSENWKLLKVSYTTANHCTKYPCWGWCWKGLVLMLQNEEWKGSFLHFRSCGAQRALGRMRSPLRIPKTLLFFLQIFNDPGVIARSACGHANVLFSQRMNQTHSVFNAQRHPKRSYQLDYGSWLSTKSQAGKR